MCAKEKWQIGRHGDKNAMFRRVGSICLFRLAAACALGSATPAWAHGITERVSLGPGGVQGNRHSDEPVISADGRFVAFVSRATNLVPGDTNDHTDVFVRDFKTGMTQRISHGLGRAQGNGDSYGPMTISADGRFVAFNSFASNLVPGDTNGIDDVFVHDRKLGITERVSLGPGGAQGNGFSGDGAISADGRFVAFESGATNLVPGGTNGIDDVFVRDRKLGITERVSLGPGGTEGNGPSFDAAISADGRFVAFNSTAANLVPGDTNGALDVFVRDRKLGITERVNLGPSGAQSNGSVFDPFTPPAMSADGRFVAFASAATNLVPRDTNGTTDVFIRDRQKDMTQRVSLGPDGIQSNGYSQFPAISADGRFVTFESKASNLVPSDTNKFNDVFIRDRQKGTTRRVSLGPGGVQGNGRSIGAAISADGRIVAFYSSARNLVSGDTNDVLDVFVRTLVP